MDKKEKMGQKYGVYVILERVYIRGIVEKDWKCVVKTRGGR